jgi:phosphoglycerate dehydrogenase-like enzyme
VRPVVDTDALLAELTSGRLRAVLDVTRPRAVARGSPASGRRRASCSPRTSAARCPLGPDRAFRIAAEQIRQFAEGNTPSNLVQDGY